MNNAPISNNTIEDKDFVYVENNDHQAEVNHKFNFSNTEKKNSKKFILYLIPIVIIITSIIGYNVYSNGFVDSPDIIQPSQTITNEPVTIISKSKPFYTKVGNNISYAKFVDKNWKVELGKIQGLTQVHIGGIIDLGFTKVRSNSTKSYTFERDYIAPKTTTDLKSKYDTKEVKYSIILDKAEEGFTIRDNQTIIYDKNAKNNNCIVDKDNQLKLNCSMTIEKDSQNSHQIVITDQYGNSSIVGEGIIKLVDSNNFNCNLSLIAQEGKIKCNGNKDSQVTIAGITQSYKASTDFEAQTLLDNGFKKIEIMVVDSDDLVKNLEYDVIVEKDKLRIDLTSSKFQSSNSAGKIVQVNSNKNVTVFLNTKLKTTDKITGKSIFQSSNYNDFLLNRNISANKTTDFYKHYTYNAYSTDGCPNCGELVQEITGYNLTFTDIKGQSVNFDCTTAFICAEI